MPCASSCQTLLLHGRAGHKPSKNTALTDIHEVFLVLNYYGDLSYGVFGLVWYFYAGYTMQAGDYILSTSSPVSQVENFVAACLSGLWPELSFNGKGRTGIQDGEEHSLPLSLFGIRVWQRLAPGHRSQGAALGSAAQAFCVRNGCSEQGSSCHVTSLLP